MTDIPKLTSDQMAELIATSRRMEAPAFYASGTMVSFSGNDASIMFQRVVPAKLANGDLAPFTFQDVVVITQMSIGTAKDLMLTLADQVATYERRLETTVETDYTRRMPTTLKQPMN